MSDEFETIDVTIEERIATIRLNRPEQLNALSKELQVEVVRALDRLAEDDGVRAVILTGNGRAFSSGYDISGELPTDVQAVRKDVISSDTFARAFWNFPKPIVAAVHGYCLAGACEIAMLCDVTVSTESCRFGEPEVRFGVTSTLVLPWLVPMKVAKELLMGGALISAARAYEIGMINRVVPDDQLMPEARRAAGLFAEMAPATVQYVKQGINAAYELAGMWSSIAHHSELATLMLLAKSEEKDTFLDLAARDGLKAALRWRDNKFKKYDAPTGDGLVNKTPNDG